MKYKPCCNRRCMVAGCEHKEQGACYCICRFIDSMKHLESIIAGRTLYDGVGMQYIPDDKYREEVLNSWSEDKKETFRKFKEEAPKLLKRYKEKLKEFQIDE